MRRYRSYQGRSGGSLPGREDRLHYPASLSFVQYLADRFPFEYLVEALDGMRTGAAPEDALTQVTREPFERTRGQWANQVVGRFVERP